MKSTRVLDEGSAAKNGKVLWLMAELCVAFQGMSGDT